MCAESYMGSDGNHGNCGEIMRAIILKWSCLLVVAVSYPADADSGRIELPKHALEDKIRGGLLGQILGNLNGVPHELKYNDHPGNLVSYVPALPEGAWTDDDTDIEWVYITEMERSGEVLLPPRRIVHLWEEHINGYIWCSNRYARDLMDLGVEPPLTGRIAVNPWSVFNIAGQFCCESFGLIAPGMPQTAARIGLHYTQVVVDGEPAQATQLFTTMIAMAFVEQDVFKLVDAGLQGVDPESEIHEVVTDVQRWYRKHPDDWRETWHAIHRKWTRHGGGMRDINGYALNTAAIIGALLYGQGDFVETLRHGFNFGWDADCNAATAGTIVGVIKGYHWMRQQGWVIDNRYRNVARPGMPDDETITRFGDRLVAVGRMTIEKRGGGLIADTVDQAERFVIRSEKPANVEPLPVSLDRREELKEQLMSTIELNLLQSPQDRARAAYLAICLNVAERLAERHPDLWNQALDALQQYPKVVEDLFNAPEPSAKSLQERARAAGLTPPDVK